MSLWRAILDRVEPVRLDLRKRFRPEAPASQVDFSIALIALSAKLAKADGQVTRCEVTVFREIMEIPPEEEVRVGRIYNLCRQETTGFETYASRIHRIIREHPDEALIRDTLLDGLFHIAMADGEYHPNEDRFLRITADRLGLDDPAFEMIRRRHVPEAWDPHAVLGVAHDADPKQIRAARNALIRTHHPDRLVSAGLPREMLRIAEDRVRKINQAHDEILAGIEPRPEIG